MIVLFRFGLHDVCTYFIIFLGGAILEKLHLGLLAVKYVSLLSLSFLWRGSAWGSCTCGLPIFSGRRWRWQGRTSHVMHCMCPDYICRTKVFRESCLDLSEGDIVEVIAGLDWTSRSRFYFRIVLTVSQSVSQSGLTSLGNGGPIWFDNSTGGGGWFYGRIISNSGVDWRLGLHEHVCL